MSGAPVSTKKQHKRQLRSQLRQSRRELSARQQRLASDKVIRQLNQQIFFQKARNIGFYWPNDGEVDLTHLTSKTNKFLYLPLISDDLRPWERQRLLFQLFNSQTSTCINKYGIVEPCFAPNTLKRPEMLDLVLIPLVGFDRSGNRLGMGKGYYDRTFRMHKHNWHRPKLVGIAHSMQESTGLDPESWDIALDAIVTENEIITCSHLPAPGETF